MNLFFLEYVGELRIIVLIVEKWDKQRPNTHTHTNTHSHTHLLSETNHLLLREGPDPNKQTKTLTLCARAGDRPKLSPCAPGQPSSACHGPDQSFHPRNLESMFYKFNHSRSFMPSFLSIHSEGVQWTFLIWTLIYCWVASHGWPTGASVNFIAAVSIYSLHLLL
jgi:hypothetical protein